MIDYGALPKQYDNHEYGTHCECPDCKDESVNENYQSTHNYLTELCRVIDIKSTELVFLADDNKEWLPKDAHRLVLEAENYIMTAWYAMRDALKILEGNK